MPPGAPCGALRVLSSPALRGGCCPRPRPDCPTSGNHVVPRLSARANLVRHTGRRGRVVPPQNVTDSCTLLNISVARPQYRSRGSSRLFGFRFSPSLGRSRPSFNRHSCLRPPRPSSGLFHLFLQGLPHGALTGPVPRRPALPVSLAWHVGARLCRVVPGSPLLAPRAAPRAVSLTLVSAALGEPSVRSATF